LSVRQECEKRETERERERETDENESDSDALPNRIKDRKTIRERSQVYQINLHDYKTPYQMSNMNSQSQIIPKHDQHIRAGTHRVGLSSNGLPASRFQDK